VCVILNIQKQTSAIKKIEAIKMRNYLYNHTSEETAYVIKDYPWGFRMRTEQRSWIESNKNGDRYIVQTKDPRTGNWCAPKKSTYAPVKVLFLDEHGHLQYFSLKHSADEKTILEFYEQHKENLNPFQLAQIKKRIAIEKVMKNVSFKFENVSFNETEEQRTAREEQEKKNENAILNAINYELKQITL